MYEYMYTHIHMYTYILKYMIHVYGGDGSKG